MADGLTAPLRYCNAWGHPSAPHSCGAVEAAKAERVAANTEVKRLRAENANMRALLNEIDQAIQKDDFWALTDLAPKIDAALRVQPFAAQETADPS